MTLPQIADPKIYTQPHLKRPVKWGNGSTAALLVRSSDGVSWYRITYFGSALRCECQSYIARHYCDHIVNAAQFLERAPFAARDLGSKWVPLGYRFWQNTQSDPTRVAIRYARSLPTTYELFDGDDGDPGDEAVRLARSIAP